MNRLKKAIQLREEGKFKDSNAVLTDLVKDYPGNAEIQYQCAWSFDVMGEERCAIPYYEAAISLGLPEEDLRGAVLGLGSTYRTLGEYEKSKEVFRKGMELFPADRAIQVFYAMTLYNLKQFHEAMQLLMINLIETTGDQNVKQYEKAIKLYSEDLDRKW